MEFLLFELAFWFVRLGAWGLGQSLDTLGALRLQRLKWKSAARQLGMTGLEAHGLASVRISGFLYGFRVTVRSRGLNLSRFRGTIEVDGPGLLPESLQLRAESPATAREKLLEGPDLESGDPAFDDAVLVRGHPVLVAAILDDVARGHVRRLVASGGNVARGWLIRPIEHGIGSTRGFIDAVRDTVELAHSLCSPRNPAPLLARNALKDFLPRVRAANVRLLARRFPFRHETAETLRAALADTADEVRLEAAIGLGDGGRAVLTGLAESEESSDAVAAAALRALGSHLGVERIAALLGRALRDGRLPVTLAAVEVLGRTGGGSAVERLCTVLRSRCDEVAASAARALGVIGNPAAQPALLTALQHPGDAVRVEAAKALGRAGTIAAIPHLRSLAIPQVDRPLREAAADAVAAIQERATGAAPGQLALAGGEAGGLALAERDARGAVTVTEESG